MLDWCILTLNEYENKATWISPKRCWHLSSWKSNIINQIFFEKSPFRSMVINALQLRFFGFFYIKHWKLISQRNKCRIWGGFPINETSKSAALPHPVDIALPVNMVIMYERGHTIGKTPLSGREYIKIKIKKNIVKSQCPSLSQSYCVMRWNDCTREAFKTGLRWQFPLRTALTNIQNLICLYLAASWLNNASLLHAKTTAGCQR